MVAGSVEARGYSAVLAIPPVLVTTGASIPLVLGESTSGTGELRLASLVAVLLAVPVFGALTYRLRLGWDAHERVLTITRRRWLGAGRTWRIGPEDLVCWYYVESLQTLVVRRRGARSLRFVLWTGNGKADRLLEWAEWALRSYAAPAAGKAASRRARRALIGGALGIGFGTMAVIMVLLLTL